MDSSGLEYKKTEDGYAVTGIGTCKDTDIVIPSEHNGEPVTEIGEDAFAQHMRLKSVVIPGSVKVIAGGAFWKCISLVSVVIFEGVVSISKAKNIPIFVEDWGIEYRGTFQECSSLKSVILPKSLKIIGEKAFCNCQSLTDVVIPEGVMIIEGAAFLQCSSLTEVSIPGTVKSLGGEHGIGCTILKAQHFLDSCHSEITFYGVFEGCVSLRNVTISGGVELIWQNAFARCSSLANIVLPDSVKLIGDGAFRECRFLTSVDIPDGVESVGDYVFYGCASVVNVIIPDNVSTIKNAFQNCTSLVSVTIGRGVTSIEEFAFAGCTKLMEVCNFSSLSSDFIKFVCHAENVYTPTIGESKLSVTADGYVFYKDGDAHYMMGYVGTEQDLVLPDVGYSYEIYQNAFKLCQCLKSVTIQITITSIGYGAFSDCTSLSSVTILSKPTSLDGMFSGCHSLTSVNIPDSVTSINGAFSDCGALASIALPDSVTSIGNSAFSGCRSLTSVRVPNHVTSICDEAFCGCSSLTSITIPDSVTSIGNSAFYFCKSLTSVRIPNHVTSIGKGAFSFCLALASVVIPDSVVSIGSSAFRSCKHLTSVTIPDSVATIDEDTFRGCSSLTSVVIPDGMESIVGHAFYNCTSLNSITIPDSVKKIERNVFEGCTSLEHVIYRRRDMKESAELFESLFGQMKPDADLCDSLGFRVFDNNGFHAFPKELLDELPKKTITKGEPLERFVSYGTDSAKIYSAGCEAFGWSLEGFKSIPPKSFRMLANKATREGFCVWFLPYNEVNLTEEEFRGRDKQNFIRDNKIIEVNKKADLKRIRPGEEDPHRLVFLKTAKGGYVYYGVFVLTGKRQSGTELTRVFTRLPEMDVYR